IIGIIVTLLVVVAGEMNWLPVPVGALQGDKKLEFVVLVVMELVLVCLIPLALKLFKFKKIKQKLEDEGGWAFLKWGERRIAMIIYPMLLNTLLYYFFANNSFGIMAVIFAICLVFIYPSKKRCEAEFGEFLEE
ncbi:MAG: hypothetical protein IKZ83_04490, partial [Prevotella sp.]|nr:hypothetical protein [Prevotella sp.]